MTDRRAYASEEIAGRISAILAAVPRGSVAIQVREKDLDGGPLLRLVREIVEVAHPAGAPVWVNERADVALAAGADGVHLPETGLAIADARAVAIAAGHRLAIGCSRHAAGAAVIAARAGADLVQLGPIWPTPGKSAPLGVDALRVAIATHLVAVGGIDGPDRARLAATSGADAVAIIRAAWSSEDPGHAIAELVAAVEAGIASRQR